MDAKLKRPNVFLVGAPKCGTTSLANWLARHPDCYLPPEKEPHYFDDYLKRGMSLADYEGLYSAATDRQSILIDASTSYLSDEGAIAAILQYEPEAKFIAMVRNPVEMAPSFHEEVYFRGAEVESVFWKAWGLQAERALGRKMPASCQNPRMLQYATMCMLGRQIARAEQLVPKGQLLVVVLEDLKNFPRNEYLRILGFLGIPDDGRIEFPVHNSAKANKYQALTRWLRAAGIVKERLGLRKKFGVRSALMKAGRVERSRVALDGEVRLALIDEFRDDVKLLSGVLGRDLSHWIS